MGVKAGFKQTEVGLIPEDWEIQPFQEMARLERGKFSARPRNDPKYFGGDIPFIQTGDVKNSRGRINAYSQTLNENGAKVSRIFPRGTLFFTIAANIGDVGIAEFAAACPDSLVAVTPLSKNDIRWLAFELSFRKTAFENLATHNAQLNINLEKLRPYLLPRPDRAEQQSIAEVLSDTDALISSLEQLLIKKRQIKQGAMQELLTGKRRLPGFHRNFSRIALGKLGVWVGGGTPSMAKEEYWKNGTIPWVTSADVRFGAIADNLRAISVRAVNESSTRIVPAGAVIVVTRSGILRRFLPFHVLHNNVAINQDIKALLPNELSSGRFIGQLLDSFNQHILASCMKSGTTVESIEMSWLKKFETSLPPTRKEQDAISDALIEMDAEITALEAKLTKARQIKQGMMQELLTGRIRLI